MSDNSSSPLIQNSVASYYLQYRFGTGTKLKLKNYTTKSGNYSKARHLILWILELASALGYQIFQTVRCHSFLPHSMPVHELPQIITINAPLILKMRDIIFFFGQTT
jgi:hypothetical protein